MSLATPAIPEIVYPQSDGKPIADNSKQFEWITILYGNLAALFHERKDVFVCGNQFWYAVEGHPEINSAPKIYVVFGRPKRDRPSYKQWEEDDVPMTVVFEVLPPSNDYQEMINKQLWYEEYGAEEYYVYDPDKNSLVVHIRRGELLSPLRFKKEFTSPRLKIRFDLAGDEMRVYYPDGRPFLSFEQLAAERQRQEQRADRAEQRADQAEQSAARLAELTLKLLAGQASDEEKQELARLAADTP
jgi:Uma2 family endonuclease